MKFLKKNGEPATKTKRKGFLRQTERLAERSDEQGERDDKADNANGVDQKERHLVGEQRHDAADQGAADKTEMVGREQKRILQQRHVQEGTIEKDNNDDRRVG